MQLSDFETPNKIFIKIWLLRRENYSHCLNIIVIKEKYFLVKTEMINYRICTNKCKII